MQLGTSDQNMSNFRSYQKIIILNPSSNTTGVVREYVLELLKYQGKRELHDRLLKWPIPRMPVGGKQLGEHGVLPGKKMGYVTSKLKEIWCEHQFQIDADALLKHLPEVLSEFEEVKKTSPILNKAIKKKK